MSVDHTAQTEGEPAPSARSRMDEYNDRSEIRVAANTVGAAFLLLGFLGFVPGITTHYGDLALAGHGSAAMLFGIFQVSILLNVVYLLYGWRGVVGSRTAVSARNYFVGGGIVFGILWLFGLVVDKSGSSNIFAINAADNWWHLVLCLGMVGLGMVMARRTTSTSGDPVPDEA
jgi:hypothetical protein